MSRYIVSATLFVNRSDADEPDEFFDEVLSIESNANTLWCEHQEDVSILYDRSHLSNILPIKPGLYVIQTMFEVIGYQTYSGDYDCDYNVLHEEISRFSDEEQKIYLDSFSENSGDLE